MEEIREILAGRWRHFKGGEYNVLGEGIHTETDEAGVVYTDAKGNLYFRPREMFLEYVRVEGEIVPRFVYVGKE